MIRPLYLIPSLLFILLGGCAAETEQATGPETDERLEVDASDEDDSGSSWWTMSDEEFAETYAGDAFSDDITKQSNVAWMLFARVNEQVPNPFGSSGTVSKWETWPTDDDTFAPNDAAAFRAEAKTRATPDFVISKAARAKGVTTAQAAPPASGEEVTRNLLAFDYIRGNGLNTLAGIEAKMGEDFLVDLPIGATEIKGNWATGTLPGAYVFEGSGGTFSLIGLHIGMKMEPTPSDPFTSEDTSWFWTTFEYKDNELRPDLEPFVTYKDQLTQAQADALLAEAGLGSTTFVNYRSNGTQIQFADSDHPDIILGNSTMEAFAAVPSDGPPFTAWNSSCHNCHGQVAMNRADQKIPIFTVEVGTIQDRTMEEWYPLDFVWGFLFAQ